MFDALLTSEWIPFTLALALLFGLCLLELAFALVGFSLLGAGEADVDAEIVLPDAADLADMDLDIEPDVLGDYDVPDVAELDGDVPSADSSGSVMAWLGLGKTPFMIWLASVLFGFGASGVALQSVATNAIGTLPVWIATPVAALAGLWFAGRFGTVFAALIPKTETSSMSVRRFGGHKGVVSQGTARAGHPAEVRVTDRHGNWHYLRLEPLRDVDEIPVGTDVLILRNRRTGDMKITALSA